MTILTRSPARTRTARLATPIATMAVATAIAMVPSSAHADVGTPVPLGAGSTFAVLAGAGVTNTGATTLAGDIGSFPTTSITGLGTITLDGGVDHGGDVVTQQAKADLVTAYNNASSQAPDPLGGVELAGLTLQPGVYDTGGVIELNGNLTLDANGDPNAVFIFQSLSTLLAGASSTVTFIDGATACNLYWRVPSSATILAGSQFAGTILAEMTISFGAAATLQGRALAQVGEVTMINNTITVPQCSTTPPVTPPTTPPATPPATPPETPATTPLTTPVASGTDGTTTSTGSAVTRQAGGAATPQVAVPPRGGVATGDGSSITPTSGAARGALAVAVVILGTIAWVSARTRRSGHHA